MTEIFTPLVLLSFVILFVLATWNIAIGVTHLRNDFREEKRMKVLKIDSTKFLVTLNEILEHLEPPFSFEISVGYLGRDINYYLVAPEAKIKKIDIEGAKIVRDYNIFHEGGAHSGVYFKGTMSIGDLNLGNIDFSKVNEIGEGVVIQLLFRKKNEANFRILISAPTPYRVSEILFALKPSFSDLKATEAKGDNFNKLVTYREFDDKAVLEWKSI